MDDNDFLRRETERVLSGFFDRTSIAYSPEQTDEPDPLAELARLIGQSDPVDGMHVNGHASDIGEAVMKYRPRIEHAFFPEDHVRYTDMDYLENDEEGP